MRVQTGKGTMHQRTADSDDEAAVAMAGDVETKRPYLRPQLVRLGTFADITRTVGSFGSADGGRARPRSRTAF